MLESSWAWQNNRNAAVYLHDTICELAVLAMLALIKEAAKTISGCAAWSTMSSSFLPWNTDMISWIHDNDVTFVEPSSTLLTRICQIWQFQYIDQLWGTKPLLIVIMELEHCNSSFHPAGCTNMAIVLSSFAKALCNMSIVWRVSHSARFCQDQILSAKPQEIGNYEATCRYIWGGFTCTLKQDEILPVSPPAFHLSLQTR